MDSTNMVRYNQMEHVKNKDKTDKVLEEIKNWKEKKAKGSLTIYFDGSGRIPRFTTTCEGC